MGQAKQRGTKEQPVAQAKAKVDALRPEKLVCGACTSPSKPRKSDPVMGF